MPFSVIDSVAGNQQIAFFGLPDTIARHQPGLMLTAEDNYWGQIEVVYGRANGAIRQFGACVLTPSLQTTGYRYDFTEAANTANQGRAIYVALTSMVAGQFGWFATSGLVPVNSTSSVAIGTAIGLAAAGQAGANSAGKQLLNTAVAAPATTTVAKTAQANAGQLRLNIQGADGWFIGAYLSGNGIAAGTVIVDIDSSGTVVTLSAATTVIVNGTVTATYNNGVVFYNVVQLNRSFLQGAIT